MNRRNFVRSTAALSLGVGSVYTQVSSRREPRIANIEVSERVVGEQRGAVMVTGRVEEMPLRFREVEVQVTVVDEAGEAVFSTQVANKGSQESVWHFSQAHFMGASRVEQIARVEAELVVRR